MYADFVDTNGLYRALDLATSPTQLGIGAAYLYYFRGGVLGNIVLMIGLVLVLLLLALLQARRVQQATPPRRRKRLFVLWRATMHQWRVPTILYIPTSFLLPAFVSLSVTLIIAPHAAIGDIIFGVLVLLGAVGYVLVVLHHTTIGMHAQLRADVVVHDEGPPSMAMRLFAPRGAVRWVSLDSDFVALYGGLFENMRTPWFCVLDLALGCIAGVLGGVIPLAGVYSLSCPAIFAIQLVCNVAYLQFIVMLRPHMVLVEAILAWVNAILGVVWGIAEVVAGSTSTPSDVGAVVSNIQLWIGCCGVVFPIIAFAVDAPYRHFVVNRWKNAVRLRSVSEALKSNEAKEVKTTQQDNDQLVTIDALMNMEEKAEEQPPHKDDVSAPAVVSNDFLRLPEPVLHVSEEKSPQELLREFESLSQRPGARPIPRATLSILVMSATLRRLNGLAEAVRIGQQQPGTSDVLQVVLECVRDARQAKQ